MHSPTVIDKEFDRMLNILFSTIDSLRDQSIEGAKKLLFDAEVLGSKLFYHLCSAQQLFKGTGFFLENGQDHIFFDHASINVLIRASFETYLTYFFIFGESGAEFPEKYLRYLTWKLSGLLDRQEAPVAKPESLEKLESEKIIIEKLMVEIEENIFFEKSNPKIQKAAKKGKWRLLKSWTDLANIAGFNREVFRRTYSYLCSYAHSGNLSALQIGQAINISDQKSLSVFSMQCGMFLMSHFIKSYRELFPKINELSELNKEMEFLLNKWFITWNEPAFLNNFINKQELQEE
jgi:hypothetical protein